MEKTIAQLSTWKRGLGVLDILNSTNALWKRLTLYWLNLINNSNQGLCLFQQKQNLRSSRHNNLQNQNNEDF